MRTIPKKIREELARDPFMQSCCLSHLGGCSGRIQWHHPWEYGGKQIIDVWATVPGCEYHHDHSVKLFLDEFKKVSLTIATGYDLAAYPKKDWQGEMRRLGEI